MDFDWDRIRIFCEVAEAGSFTRAGELLNLNQSSVSRHISTLEHELKVPLFRRHARGLVLTEHGEVLFKTALEMRNRLQITRNRLDETTELPSGKLTVTATVGIGAIWLAQRIAQFLDLYPDVRVELIVTNDELDLSMREADVAIRLRRPSQADLIQRRLFTVHYQAYASRQYIERFGEPKTLADLDNHRIVSLGGPQPGFIASLHQLASAGRDPKKPRAQNLIVNDSLALRHAVEAGAGIGMAPTYSMEGNPRVVRVLEDVEMPSLESYFVYPEELRSVARVQAFRDFLVAQAQRWTF